MNTELPSSIYEGNLVGSGTVVFAVMGYVISKQEPVAGEFYVELNPVVLSFILGCHHNGIQAAIKFLCTKGQLEKRGEYFTYRVVNGSGYRQMGRVNFRREQWRESKRRKRATK